MSRIEKVGAYEIGYSKGQSAILTRITNEVLENEGLAYDFRSKKQYRNMLLTVLKGLAEDSWKREKFMRDGKITIQETDGKLILR